jgi:protoporphyrinogen oxidase
MKPPVAIKTLIIGAGPAGLAAAMELQKANEPFAVVEKEMAVGGLARTYLVKEGDLLFRTDNGPHRFFSQNQYLYDFISDLLDERWLEVRRRTRQWIEGKLLDYPINALQVVRTLGFGMVVRVLFDYARSVVKYRWLKSPVRNFRDFAYASFGKALADFNILNYTEKVWGQPPEQLHMDWADQRIKGLNLGSMVFNLLKTAVGIRGSGPKSLVDTFYYPETGTGLVYETIAERIAAHGRQIFVGTRPVRIAHDGQRVTTVTLTGPEGSWDIAVEYLIESVHLTDFVGLLDPAPPEEIREAAGRLRYRTQVYLFVTLDRDHVTNDQWIYFPGSDVPFERWSEMKNFSHTMSPPGKTSLFIEFFCFDDDPKRTMTAESLLELVLPIAAQGGFFTREDVRHAYVFRGGKDYPIYDLAYKDNLAVVKRWLDGLENLFYVGRPGRFKYTNQDHSLEMGMLAAYSIIDGRRFDIEAVGSEREYFERGTSPSPPSAADGGRGRGARPVRRAPLDPATASARPRQHKRSA